MYVKLRLGYNNCFSAPSNGRARGLALFCSDDVPLRVTNSSAHHIDAEIGAIGDLIHWHVTGFYSFAATVDRHKSWDLIR